MTNPQNPKPWPLPTGQYRHLANWLVENDPDAAMKLVEATNERTDYAEAASRVAAESILAISFGLIARLRIDEPSLEIARAIGNAWVSRALGQEPSEDIWTHLHGLASARLAAAEDSGQEWPATIALRGLTIAAQPNSVTVVRDIIEYAVMAWNRDVEDQHAAVMFWATDTVVTHTRAARKADDDE